MKISNIFRFTFLAFVLLSVLSVATAPLYAESLIYSWLTNIDEALAALPQEDNEGEQYLLVYFAGSDWCPHCERFDEEVLNTPLFSRLLASNFVPVLIDFPRNRSISEAQQNYNEQLFEEYAVQGFPTVVILDTTGSEVYRTGYGGGGVRRFRTQLMSGIENATSTEADDTKDDSEIEDDEE